MPELPDVTVYVEALERYVGGRVLEKLRIASPFVVRSVTPPISAAEGKRVTGVRRMGKRIVIGLEEDLSLVVHLMIAGRLRWRKRGAALSRKMGLAAFDFANGTVLFTEASSKKRASLHLIEGAAAVAAHDRGGVEPLEIDLAEFRRVLVAGSHTLKRALTDPRQFSGIGNAYSDEILHAARLSPMKRARQLSDEEVARLYDATRETLRLWVDRLRGEVGDGFPEKVTAFRKGMAVHGRYGQPCPVCGAPVQRIVYAENEANYCARCQTGGRRLADRGLSRVLHDDWPRTLEELETKEREAASERDRG